MKLFLQGTYAALVKIGVGLYLHFCQFVSLHYLDHFYRLCGENLQYPIVGLYNKRLGVHRKSLTIGSRQISMLSSDNLQATVDYSKLN